MKNTAGPYETAGLIRNVEHLLGGAEPLVLGLSDDTSADTFFRARGVVAEGHGELAAAIASVLAIHIALVTGMVPILPPAP